MPRAGHLYPRSAARNHQVEQAGGGPGAGSRTSTHDQFAASWIGVRRLVMSSTSRSTFPQSSDDRSLAVDAGFRRLLHLILVLLVGASALGLLGVKTTVSADERGDFHLSVHHATVTRGGLATPLDITVRRASGLPSRLMVEIDSEYLAAFDENGLSPDSVASYRDGVTEAWTFAVPPDAGVFEISLDARLEPAVQSSRSAHVRLLVDGEEEAVVAITTRVMP